jgi:hypothetical protein
MSQFQVRCAVCPSTKLVDSQNRRSTKKLSGWEAHVLYQIRTVHTCSPECKQRLYEMVERLEAEQMSQKIAFTK